MNQLAIFALPPVSEFPVQPSDVSESKKIPCPTCNNDAWLSIKKQIIIETGGYDVHMECFDCLRKRVISDDDFRLLVKNALMRNI